MSRATELYYERELIKVRGELHELRKDRDQAVAALRSALALLTGDPQTPPPVEEPRTRPYFGLEPTTHSLEHGVTFAPGPPYAAFTLNQERKCMPLTESEIAEMDAIKHSYDRPAGNRPVIQPTADDLEAFEEAAAASRSEET